MKFAKCYLIVFCLLFSLFPVSAQKPSEKATFKIEFEKFTLPNGLEVIFHIDRSDPVVAITTISSISVNPEILRVLLSFVFIFIAPFYFICSSFERSFQTLCRTLDDGFYLSRQQGRRKFLLKTIFFFSEVKFFFGALIVESKNAPAGCLTTK